MTESDTRAVLLMRAFEQGGAMPVEDADWADREARRQLGENADPRAWLARRARLALGRLVGRDRGLRPVLTRLQRPPGVLLPGVLLLAALLLGMLGESLGADRHINLLAPPMLGLLVWNAAVYLGLMVHALRRRPVTPGGLGAIWTRWSGRGLRRLQGVSPPARVSLAQYGIDWLAVSAPLQAARSTALMHAGAAALALGAVAAMYGRGLVFDYQAGWDSTFLQPLQVRWLLSAVLAPASALAGLPLPDEAGLAALRLVNGGGESAAPWIHRWAITLGLAVVLPRTLLAGLAWWRARRLAADLPLPDDESLRRLLHRASGVSRAATVLSYSYQLDAPREQALAPALERWLGPGLRCQLQHNLPLGAEDDLPAWLPAVLDDPSGQPGLLVLLFAMIATPERESHGALVTALSQALAAQPAPRPLLRVAVDESGFRQRLIGADGVQRLAQRRAAWEALLIGQGVVPGFIDLSAPPAPAA